MKATKEKTKYLTEQEFNKLIRTIEKTKGTTGGKFYLRDRLMFLLAFEAGLRASEVGNLRKEDFTNSANGMEIYCRRLKGSSNNTVKLSQGTGYSLKKFMKEFPNESEYIFMSRKGTEEPDNKRNGLEDNDKRACAGVEIKDFIGSTYTVRKTWAIFTLSNIRPEYDMAEHNERFDTTGTYKISRRPYRCHPGGNTECSRSIYCYKQY
jgi:integrase